MAFVELHCHSYYSFLRGASSPEDLVYRAAEMGMPALALTDFDGLYGAIPFVRACEEVGIKPVIGATLTLEGNDQIVVLCRGMGGYHRLSPLITKAYEGREKGDPLLTLEALEVLRGHVAALAGGKGSALYDDVAHRRLSEAKERLEAYQRVLGKKHVYVELNDHREEGDRQRCDALISLGAPTVTSNAVRYADDDHALLYDVLCCIKHRVTLEESHHLRYANRQRGLKMLEAEARTVQIAEECAIQLDFSSYRFPEFETPKAESHEAYLKRLCYARMPEVYGQSSEEHFHKLDHELALIAKLKLAGYFLVVWDIVEYAKKQNIPCQGRGSAANSMVAYVLGITPVDPIQYKLFLGRFINEDMVKIPDIDLDFASSRDPHEKDREDVIRYVYERYGSQHVAMVCTFITFKARSAIREVGKVFGIPEPTLEKMAKMAGPYTHVDAILKDLEPELNSPLMRQFAHIVQLIGDVPRHVGIHVGGMLIASRPIAELVPLEPARMEGRVVCQWDKDMVEDAGLIKVDILGLGMLAVLREGRQLAEEACGKPIDLFGLSLNDPRVYASIASADTVGVFQVESRAQMQSLPRTQPRNFDELGIQVAIIRPGPLQGNMVAPYIRRRQGMESVAYLHPSLAPILQDTLGVILFQEQVLQVAVAIADFSPGQADALRRAMSRSRSQGAMERIKEQFMEGARQKGIPLACAQSVLGALEGFALYGFCKSHALAFAKIAYLSGWLKIYHPAAFYAALLNNQPMGFYPSESLVQDARRHDVEVLPVDVNASRPRCHVENGALRLGYIMVKGLKDEWMYGVEEKKPFFSLSDFYSRTAASRREVEHLIQGGAFDSLGLDRRELLWQLWLVDQDKAEEMPLLHYSLDTPDLPRSEVWDRLVNEYSMMGFSPHIHPMALMRGAFQRQGLADSRQLATLRQGESIAITGVVVCRQKPPTAKGFSFLTLEDEFGMINVVIPPKVYDRCRYAFRQAPMLKVDGDIDTRDRVINIKARFLSAV